MTQETTFKNCIKWRGWPYIHSDSSEGRIPFRLERSIFSSGRLHQRDWLVHWEREMTWWYRRPIVKLWVPGRKRWQNCSTQISDPWGGWAKYTLSAFSTMPGTEGWVLLAGMTFGYHLVVCQEVMMCVDRMERVRIFDLSFTYVFSYNFQSNIVRWALLFICYRWADIWGREVGWLV